MPRFSQQSWRKLKQCDIRLVNLFSRVVEIIDCAVSEGHRSKEAQDEYFRTGKSKVKFPNGKHNTTPSKAADVIVYPIDWRNIKRFYYFAGVVKGVAEEMGLDIRWGGDWDSDNDLDDQTFMDLVHFELLD